MSSMILSMKDPCNESWDAMTPKGDGRHCAVCEKTILDLSNKSDAELIQFFSETDRKFCGRIPMDKMNKVLTFGENSAGFSLNLRAVVMGATLLVSYPLLAVDYELEVPQFSLVQSIIDDTLINADPDGHEYIKIRINVFDKESMEPVFAAKILALDNNENMIVGALSDFDGEAELRFTPDQLQELSQIKITSIEYVDFILEDVETTRESFLYEVLLTPEHSAQMMMGIMIVDADWKKAERKSKRAMRRERRAEKRAEKGKFWF